MSNMICMWCGTAFDSADHKQCPYCYEGHCFGCGIAPGDGYTPGCKDCDESRAALHAMTGDTRYLEA